MRRLAWTGIALGAGVGIVGVAGTLRAADHRDAPAVQMAANVAADINDVFAWMSEDASKLNLAMTVLPFAEEDARFSDAVQYVFHINSMAAYGEAATETLVMCTFAADQSISCWAGEDEQVSGDASDAAGIASDSGGLKVFAGLRNDPFFFNLDGFNATVAIVEGAAGGLTFDEAGCPDVDGPTSAALVEQLQSESPDNGGGAAVDDFAGHNTLAIVVQVDKALVSGGGAILGVWGSTNEAE